MDRGWTSPDPYKGSMNLGDPQSFNRYSYVQNQPTNFVDPSGLQMAFCVTYEYGMEYKFEDGTIIRVPEGRNTVCFGGGPPETGLGTSPSGNGASGGPGAAAPSTSEDDHATCVAEAARKYLRNLGKALADYGESKR